MQNNDALVVPFFKAIAVPDQAKSKAEGRPIFRDQEVVEVRIAGDRNFAPVFPAHSMWKRVDGEEITYAQRWAAAYTRFKDGREQVADGTPLSELPFLTEAKRAELRSLKVYTAEALASIDGKNLANLGAQGREMKTQAQAYLDTARGTAGVTAMAAKLEALQEEVLALRAAATAVAPVEPMDEGGEKSALKEQIEALTGAKPRGNPSVETLREMLADLKG